MQWQGVTFEWYHSVIDNEAIWESVRNSLFLAICSSTIATVLATLAATCFHYYHFAGKKLLYQIILLLIIIPDIVLAVALLIFYNMTHLALGFTSLLIAHVTFSIPFGMLLIQNRIKKLNSNLFTASQDLGATDFYAFKKVILPLLKTAIFSAWLLSFTLSFDDVLISYFAAGPEYQILPLYIYSLIRTGIKPEINALCSIVFLLTVISVTISYCLLFKKSDDQHA